MGGKHQENKEKQCGQHRGTIGKAKDKMPRASKGKHKDEKEHKLPQLREGGNLGFPLPFVHIYIYIYMFIYKYIPESPEVYGRSWRSSKGSSLGGVVLGGRV